MPEEIRLVQGMPEKYPAAFRGGTEPNVLGPASLPKAGVPRGKITQYQKKEAVSKLIETA
jgi:hypothetical protein